MCYSVSDKLGVYRTVTVVARDEDHAKSLALAKMYGCPLSDVDATHVKESLASLQCRRL